MKIIGLTGGIGSGKTTVANIFKQIGVPVFCCDDVARNIQNTDQRAIDGMIQLFGSQIYNNGHLNRGAIAQLVFANKDLLQKLNNIIHPLVKEEFQKFCQTNSTLPFVLIESAIMIQSGFYTSTDFMILVTANIETRISRVIMRDKISREQVLQRIQNQMSDDKALPFCRYTIINNNIADLLPQIQDVLSKES
jgi:dephospho-CoA kinase